MSSSLASFLPVVGLLVVANGFMTIAWYGHLKYPHRPLWLVVLASWGIALLEYMFQVPANRLGAEHGFPLAQLKITQECISLVVFTIFVAVAFKERPRWNHYVSYALLVGAVYFAFRG